MAPFKEERGAAKGRTLSSQFSINKLLIEVTDWKGDLLVIRWDEASGDAWATQHVRIPAEGGPLQGVGTPDARASNSTRQTTIQDHVERRQRDEQALQEAQETLSSSKASKPAKSPKAGLKRNAKIPKK